MAKPSEKSKSQECLYGAVTVGERGQIVIPAEARKEMDIHPGDKLLVCRHPTADGLFLFKIDAVREFMQRMMENLERVEQDTNAASPERDEA